jgi:PAS domain S-box-containing protein
MRGKSVKHFDIRLRLGATFCLLTAVLFIVGWQGIHHLRQLDQKMQEVIFDRWSEEQLVREAFRLSNLNSRITLSIFLLDDADEINRLLVQRAANTERISGLVRAIEPRLDTEEEKRLLAAVEAARKPYVESYLQALAKLVDEHQRDEARKMMAEVTLPRIAVYHAAWNAFTQCQVDKIEQGIQQSKADFAAAQRRLLFLVALAGLIAVAIAGYVIFRVTREIAERERAEEALRQSYDLLEQRIQQRTAELEKTNQALQAEITGRKQIEKELQRQKTELRVLFDWMPAMVCFKDTENRILRANKRIAEIVGKSVEEIEGKPIVEIFPQEAAKYYSDDLEVIHSGAPKLGIVETLRDREGKEQWGQTDKVPVCDQDGKVTGIIVMTQDITARKRLEAQLLQSQKMETVGKLAGGIAHEFNSLLTTIIGHSEFLLNDLPAESPLANNATEISKAAGRAAMLTRQLLAYGRKQFLQPETLDLNQVITDMKGVFQHLMGEDVDTRIVPAPGLQAVMADAGQIEQVIMNLAINARDAMPGGGKLTLETANVSFDQDSAGRSPELKPGDYVMLAIADTGTGMTAEVKAHVFEPFFSTKGVGQGAGLGLSTCYGIVKQSGGHITVYSELGRGTTFKIYLPQVEPAPKIPLPRLDSPDLQRGTETILLVEDDSALREMAATMLSRLGYTVLAAADGIEALSLKQQRDNGHIDLLFTDVVMPHMSGKELADRVRALYPHIRVLFTSAYTENAIVHQGVLNQGVKLLQKPFTPSALARKLREVLDEPPPPAGREETGVQSGNAIFAGKEEIKT